MDADRRQRTNQITPDTHTHDPFPPPCPPPPPGSPQNVVVYSGSAVDRATIERHELWTRAPDGARVVKPHVVLSSYEMVLREGRLFNAIDWDTVVIDEVGRAGVCVCVRV
jgi:hypothetical protein